MATASNLMPLFVGTAKQNKPGTAPVEVNFWVQERPVQWKYLLLLLLLLLLQLLLLLPLLLLTTLVLRLGVYFKSPGDQV